MESIAPAVTAARAPESTDPLSAERIVCRCLQVSETEILSAVETCGARTVKELGRCTGAGQGCTACHFALRKFVEG
jgi:NAD(P)H-nitrite reductase large subunit